MGVLNAILDSDSRFRSLKILYFRYVFCAHNGARRASMSTFSEDRLPREILKWIQSLDLAYSIRRAKRDFANGFLVAEIFSRYDPHKVEMHSFDSGISTKVKRGNWKLLRKHFNRRGFDVSDDEIEGILMCRRGRIVPFLCRAYAHLTGRTCKLPPVKNEEPPAPAFMQSTASYAIRRSLESSHSKVTDRKQLEASARETLAGHHSVLSSARSVFRSERLEGQEQSQQLGRSKVVRGTETRPVARSTVLPKIITRQVKVKQIDQAVVAQMRLNQSSSTQDVKSPVVLDVKQVVSSETSSSVDVKADEEADIVDTNHESAFSLFDEAVARRLSSMIPETKDEIESDDGHVKRMNDSKCLASLIRSVSEGDHDVTLAVLGAIEESNRVGTAAELCKRKPDVFFDLTRHLLRAMDALPSSTCDAFCCATSVLRFLGKGLRGETRDGQTLARRYFIRYVLPLASYQSMLRKSSRHRKSLLRVMREYVETKKSTIPMDALRALQFELNDSSTFLLCLGDLVNDTDSRGLDVELDSEIFLKFCMTHCKVAFGRGEKDENVLRSGIVILGHVAERKRQFASECLSMLEMSCTHPSIAVRAQVCETVAKLIPCFDFPSPEHDTLSKIAIKMLTDEKMDITTRRFAVIHFLPVVSQEIAHHLREGGSVEDDTTMKRFLRTTVHALLNMSKEDREKCLGDSDDDEVVTLDGVDFTIPSMVREWDGCCVVTDVAEEITRQKSDFIEPEHMEVVAAAVTNSDLFDQDTSRWTSAFAGSGLMEYVFVAMCDPDCCDFAIRTLHTFVNGPKELRHLVLRSDALIGALRLLFSPDSESDVLSQHAVTAFFSSGVNGGEPIASEMQHVLRTARPGLKLTPALESLMGDDGVNGK